MQNWKKGLILAASAATLLIGGLLVKNMIDEKKTQVITKEETIKILKLLRKEKYGLYNQIATYAIKASTQTKGIINIQAVEQFINGPNCPFQFQKSSKKIFTKICQENGIDFDDFDSSLQKYQSDEEITELREKQFLDYKGALNGKLPIFQIEIPAKLTKEKFYELQSQIAKKSFIHQMNILKIMSKHTELQIQQNPSLLVEIGNPNLEMETEEMLRQQGLDSDFEPGFAVYQAAVMKFSNDKDFQQRLNQIQAGYHQILMRYYQKIQRRIVTAAQLIQMQEQILLYQPI